MANLLQDFRFAFRTLRKSPVFTMVAVASLALGIGANTAIFTLVNQLLLKMLPVRAPEELVLLDSHGSFYGSNTGSNAISYPMYQDIRDRNQVFSGIFCRYGQTFAFSDSGKTQVISGELVSGNYFPVLGIGAAAGRVFSVSDDLMQHGHPVAVISYDFWRSQFALDPSAINRKITLNGYPFTIIGVSQEGFHGIDPSLSPQIRIPMSMKAEITPGPWYSLNDRRSRFANVFGRLKPGMTIDLAKAGLQPLYHSILDMEVKEKSFAKATDYTRQQFLRGWVDVLPAATGRSQTRKQYRTPLLVLTAVVGLVLLIACANLANLLVARAAARRKEVSIRIALGAGRGRLIRQLLVESVLLSVAGGVCGLLLAMAMTRGLLAFIPTGSTPLALSPIPDWRVLAFNAFVSLLTGVVFGLMPSLQATNADVATTLKDQAGAVVGGGSVRMRKVLVTAQVTLSLLLLIGAGLFVRTLGNLHGADPGFRLDQLITFEVNPPMNGYKPERSWQFYRELLDRLNAQPGVFSATLAVVPVLDDNEWDSTVTVEGYARKQGEDTNPHMQYTEPGFFRTLGIPMTLGRDFTTSDVEGAPKVAIVNEKFVTRFLNGMHPLGHKIGMGGDPGTKTDITIIGVVKDTKYESMRAEIPFELYLPGRQSSFVIGMTAYVRTSRPPDQMFTAVRRIVREIDPAVPVSNLRTLDEQLDRSLSIERLVATLSAVFGCLATFLAAIGLYGVMAYSVTRRTQEIGIRMALGANRGNVVWMVMREVLVLMAVGIAVGLPAALALSKLVRSQLYGVEPNDPVVIAAAVVLVAAVAGLSGYGPGRRATRIQPMQALRWE